MRVARSCCFLSLAAPLMLGSPAQAELPDTFWYDGFAPAPDGQGLDAPVTALGEHDGDLIAGGLFSSGGGTPLNHIGVWDGTAWAALGSGVNDAPRAFTTFEGDLVAGGAFTEAGGQSAAYVARWDGSSWSAMGQGMNDEVRALTVFQGELYAGGGFLIAGGQLVAYVARWDGVDWQPVGNGFNGKVEELVEFNGQLVAVGTFDQAEGSMAKHIAVWDGVSWAELGGGTSARVRAAVVADSSLYIGGEFATVGAVDARRVARWDGSKWHALGEGLDGEVFSLARYNDTIVAAGDFTQSGTTVVAHVARWNAAEWLLFEEGVDAGADAVAMAGGSLFVGGEFATAGSQPSAYLSRWGEGGDGVEYVPAEFASINAAIAFGAGSLGAFVDVILAPGTYDETIGHSTPEANYVTIRGCASPEETKVRSVQVSFFNFYSLTLERLLVEEETSLPLGGYVAFEDCVFQGPVSSSGWGVNDETYARSCKFATSVNLSMGLGYVRVSNSTVYGDLLIHGGEDGSGGASDCWVQGRLSITQADQFGSFATRCSVATGDLTVQSTTTVLVSGCTVMAGNLIAEGGDYAGVGGNSVRGGKIVVSTSGTHYGAPPTMSVLGNAVQGPGAGISVSWPNEAETIRISGNTVVGGDTGIHLHGAATDTAAVTVEKNIIAGCGSTAVDIDRIQTAPPATLTCNTFWSNVANVGGIPDPIGFDGNFEANPWFCDPDAGDYHLTTQSPCLPGNHPAGADCDLIGALGAGCTLLADMVVGQVLCSPDTTFWSGDGDSVAIGAVVTNGGLFPTEPSFARIEVTGCIGFWGDTRAIAALQPGESDTAWVGPFPRDLVACEVDITADFFDDVVEADEDNNAVAGVTPCAVVGVDGEPSAGPLPLRLHVPNPWRAGGEIRFSGADAERVDIFDVSGRRVRSWRVDASSQSLAWDTRDEAGRAVRPGRYFLRLVGRDETTTRAITVLR